MRAFSLVALLLTGCTSSTIINSRPTGALVSLDGQSLGQTPTTWSETVWVGTKHTVRLSMPGYSDAIGNISADQWSVGRVVVSVLCFLPGLLWSTEFRPSYEFALQPAAPYPQPGLPPGYAPQPQGYGPPPAPAAPAAQ